MNTILADYQSISELELNKRIAFYEHLDFSTETIEVLIPDVVSYVRKIFHCLRWAEQSREIIDDVCQQIIDKRTETKRFMQSVSYRVGTLNLDGRAYAQQNIHQYCRYIAETNDCFCQILNIVFNAGYRQWNRMEMDRIRKHPNVSYHPQILKLWDRYYELIKTHKFFDNFEKHNLITWGTEQLSPSSLNNVEYYFDKNGQNIPMTDWINDTLERKIKVAAVELLDNIFALASAQNNPKRRYVHILFDVLMVNGLPPVYSDRFLAHTYILPVKLTTKVKGKQYIVDSISYTHDGSPIANELYLARLDQELIESDMMQSKLSKLDFDSFDVISGGKLIGQYRCTSPKDKNIKYFHFVKYIFYPTKS